MSDQILRHVTYLTSEITEFGLDVKLEINEISPDLVPGPIFTRRYDGITLFLYSFNLRHVNK